MPRFLITTAVSLTLVLFSLGGRAAVVSPVKRPVRNPRPQASAVINTNAPAAAAATVVSSENAPIPQSPSEETAETPKIDPASEENSIASLTPMPPLVKKRPLPNFDEAQNKMRMHRAETIKSLGYDVDWTNHSSAELLDMELRIREAQTLQQLGYEAQWRYETLEELTDKEARLRKAQALEKQGVVVNWTKTSLDEMTEIENRIRKANRLHQLGKTVDWQKYSLAELKRMELTALRTR